MASTVSISAGDAREVAADLEAVELGLGRAAREGAAQGAQPILAQAITNAPFDALHRGWRRGTQPRGRKAKDPGHINANLRLEARAFGAALVTTHPAGALFEFGGTIAPQGVDISIAPHLYAARAGEQKGDEAARETARNLDELLRAHGL